jgi:class 3 adenylate cyclase
LYERGCQPHGPAGLSDTIAGYYHLAHMIENAVIGSGAGAYRGFLFSDMRGFTAFAERYGNSAAAAMVGRFLEIARTAIARHQGAEITTEGDAIHAVFSSASSAVLCGLEIVDAAAEMNTQQPDRPLGLGVGVHAGEAVETAEGYIGRAVNIAARLCAAAKPGEVLVSSTVKGITQSSIQVGFIPRGRRRLKGIADPIVVYAVTRDMNAKASVGVPRLFVLGGAGVAVAVVIAVTALAGSQLLPKPSAAPTARPTPVAQRIVIGPLPIGKYASTQFQPETRFDIRDLGWAANNDVAGKLGLTRTVAPLGNLDFLRVDEMIDTPCGGIGEATQPALGPADLLTRLQALDYLTVSDPETVRVGGYTGRRVDVTVAESALAACAGPVGGGVTLFSAAGEIWNAAPGERFTLIFIGVGDQSVTISVSMDWTQTPSVQQLEDLLDAAQRVLDSVAF